MAYDPTKPANNSPVSSPELRSQLAGLKDEIDQRPTTLGMNTAISGQTAGNCTGVNYLALTVSDPPTQAQVQAIADKLDQILMNLRRE
jgi:hypothetical protein